MSEIIATSGYRHFKDSNFIFKILNEYTIKKLITGDATGSDAATRFYAQINSIPIKVLNADWNLYGLKAGPIRNGWILDEKPDLVICFKHKNSKGTKNMIKQAKERKIPLRIIDITQRMEDHKNYN